jgi:lipopolysaccharide export system permease protein
MSDNPRLLFITSTRIGDAVLGSGALAYVLDQMPGARVTVAGGPLVAPLFDGVPGLDRFIAMRKRSYSRHWLMLWQETVGTRWDMIVDLRGSVVSWLLWRRRLIRWSSQLGASGHQVERVGRLIGVAPPPSPRLFPSQAQRATGAALVAGAGPVLAIGPTANGRDKEWPQDRFAELITWVVSQKGLLPGARITLFGAAEDRDRIAELRTALKDQPVIDCFGAADLGSVGQAIGDCALYIGNDSGLMHMAAASGVPTFGLFGDSPPERYAPWGANAGCAISPVGPEEGRRRLQADGTHPMHWLTLDQVKADLSAFWTRVKG